MYCVYIYTYMYVKIYMYLCIICDKELAHLIMETDKFQGWQLASQRPRRAVVLV